MNDELGLESTELFRVLSSASEVDESGSSIAQWCADVIRLCAHDLEAHFSGGWIIPQFGQDAGTLIPIEVHVEYPSAAEYAEWNQATRKFAKALLQTDNRKKKAEYFERNNLVIVPVALGSANDHPIGILWCKAQTEREDYVKRQLKLASEIIRKTIVQEKANRAIRELAKQTWMSEVTSRTTAKETSIRCKDAIGCKDVVIWELQEKSQGIDLTTLACTAEINLDMHLGEGLAGVCAMGSEIIVIDDLFDENEIRRYSSNGVKHKEIVKEMGWRSAMFLPLDIGGEIVGVMGIYMSRPYGWNELDRNIGEAFAQRLCSGYIHFRRIEQLTDLEKRVALEAPAMEAAMLAMERVHDSNNSLVFAQDRLSDIAGLYKHEKRSRVYRSAIEASDHVRKAYTLTKRLADYATVRPYNFKKTKISDILDHCFNEIVVSMNKNRIRHKIICNDEILIDADFDYLERAFSNFLNNSVFFLSNDTKSGQRMLSAKATKSGQMVEIEFSDNGPGIAPHDISKAFEYLYTTRSKGMGFGLPIARRIIVQHNGKIEIASRWGYSTTVRVQLPIIPNKK